MSSQFKVDKNESSGPAEITAAYRVGHQVLRSGKAVPVLNRRRRRALLAKPDMPAPTSGELYWRAPEGV
jgi:hypothetical protein